MRTLSNEFAQPNPIGVSLKTDIVAETFLAYAKESKIRIILNKATGKYARCVASITQGSWAVICYRLYLSL